MVHCHPWHFAYFHITVCRIVFFPSFSPNTNKVGFYDDPKGSGEIKLMLALLSVFSVALQPAQGSMFLSQS